MTVLTQIDVDGEEFAMGRALSHAPGRIRLTQMVPVDEQMVPYFWAGETGDPEAFEEGVRESPHVDELTRLDGRLDSGLYRIDWAEVRDGFLRALSAEDVLVERAEKRKESDRWRFRIRAFDRDALSEFQGTCARHDVAIEVRRVVNEPEAVAETRLLGLTEKQYEALRLALDSGYFHVPREASLTELAEELDISRQAFSNRLSRAEQRVLDDLLGRAD
jgi:hypothetical protein